MPKYLALLARWGEAYGYLLATVQTPGDLATVINMENHQFYCPLVIASTGKRLAQALGGTLPLDAQPRKEYTGLPRLIVPTLRGSMQAGERLKINVIYLHSQAPRDLALWWRPLGKGKFRRVAASHIARGVYEVALPPPNDDVVEFHLKAVAANGQSVLFPATAPRLNQTVVVVPA